MNAITSGRQARTTLKYIGLALLFLFLAALTLRSASALSITGVNAPSSLREGETLAISFTTDVPASYTILQGGAVVSATNSYAAALGYDDAGLLAYTFEARAGTETVQATRTIEVIDTPLAIAVIEPAETDYASSAVPVSVATSIPAGVCYTVVGTSANTLTAANSTSFNGTLSLADGVRSVAIRCSRGSEIAEAARTLRIDTRAPTITLSPAGTLTQGPAVLSATTDEIATCRYGAEERLYPDLPHAFSGGAALTHSAELALAEGSYRYYVACRDVAGNIAAASTAFAAQYSPTAEVEVEGDNPRKAGSYDVTLRVSEELEAVPTLTLSYQGGSASTLALTRKDALTYEGLIVVEEDAGELVGSFQFKGRDRSGLEGTRLTASELFVVDTIKPARVGTFSAVNGSRSVNLTWFYDGGADRFNIYRSSELGVEYTDFLTSASGTEFRDYDVADAVTYYYRIAAVDDAGNVGELSHEEYASPAAALYAEERLGAILDPALQVGLDSRIADVERRLLDADRSVRDLQSVQGAREAAFVSALGLLEEAQAARKGLALAKDRLEALRSLDLSREEFASRVTAIDADREGALARLPVGFSLGDGSEWPELPSGSDLDAAIARVLSGRTLSSDGREAYVALADALQEGARTATSVTYGTVTYADGLVQPYTLVEKRISLAEPADVLAIETIPKEVASRASDLSFKPRPVVLEEDPVVQYSFDGLSETSIAYAIKGTVDATSVRNTRLVLLPEPGVGEAGAGDDAAAGVPPAAPSQGTLLSGNVIGASLLGGQGLFVILGLVVIAGLVLYYFRLGDESLALPSQASLPLAAPIVIGGHVGPRIEPARATTVIVSRREEPFTGLLYRGHALIDENKYLDALYFYRLAVARFDAERFGSESLREAVRAELELLHAKLSLFDALSKAHDAAYAGDREGLVGQMERMRTHAAAVGEAETPLVAKARMQYSYLYSRFNVLRAEGPLEEDL